MKKVFVVTVLAAFVAICGPSYGLANGLANVLSYADIDPGECEVDFEGTVYGFEPANAHVIANQNWVIAECHVKLTKDKMLQIGGPFQKAQHYWDFDCEIETEGTAEDIPAFASHAVLSPSGVLNVLCVAVFEPETLLVP